MSEQLQGRELDAALARALGMTVVPFQDDEDYCYADAGTSFADVVSWSPVRAYHDDLNAMRDVEDEIERRGLGEQYAEALIEVLSYPELYYTMPGDDVYPEPEIYTSFYGAFQVMHATAEQKARAALAVLMEAK